MASRLLNAINDITRFIQPRAARVWAIMTDEDGSTFSSWPTITAGSGVPTEAQPNGSEYHRTNGEIYIRVGGVWTLEDAAAAAAAAALAQIDATSALADAAAAQATADACNNRELYAVLDVADIGGGVLDTTLTCTVRRENTVGDVPSLSQRFLILATSVQFGPPVLDATVSFSAATSGAIVASGAGWALVASEANNPNSFACTVSRAAPGTAYFRAEGGTASDSPNDGALAITSNSDGATWSV